MIDAPTPLLTMAVDAWATVHANNMAHAAVMEDFIACFPVF
jgi:hypothetical protein